AVQTAAGPAAPIEPSPAPAVPAAPIRAAVTGSDWPALIEAMQLRGMVRQLAENCTMAARNAELVHLRLDPAHAHLHSPALEKKLAEALNAQFGNAMKLRIEALTAGDPAAVAEETPAQRQAREARERQLAAERSIAEDDTVRTLEETFGAQVQRDTVRPLE
ncbi:MAG TPA: DNA polymerase III subunit gamma/tau C-terminal domain-containing protein, partial [Gammaproteobacteria bacterium]